MKIAVVGCLHGKLDQVYKDVKEQEKCQGFPIDVVVVCGDFQAARNENDLKCMAVPKKCKELGDFHEYYKGVKYASHLTLVIGGNHEASNYFQTLPYGGWIAPNIFYLGYSNVVKVNGVKIAGISGIFNRSSTNKGHYEFLPYTNDSIRTVYHTRYLEVFRMMQVKEKLDVILTHDWPLHIYEMPNDIDYLLKKRPSLKDDIENDLLGSPMYEFLLKRLRPKHWFSAHLHVRFQTMYAHKPVQFQTNKAINLSSTNEKTDETTDKQKQPEITHFLALDKCMLKRTYLEIVNVQSDPFDISGLEYDLEWLSILKATDEYVSSQEYPPEFLPHPHSKIDFDLNQYSDEIKKAFGNNFKIPNNFTASCLPFNNLGEDIDPERKNNYINEQTCKFCKLLGITDPLQCIVNRFEGKIKNPDKIDIEDCEDLDWFEKESTRENADNDKNKNGNILAIEYFNVKQEKGLQLIDNDEEMDYNKQVNFQNNIEEVDDFIGEHTRKKIKKEPLFFFDTEGVKDV